MNSIPKTTKVRSNSISPGFTIVELIAAIGIMVVLLAVAVPMTTNSLRQRGARDAAEQLAMDLQRAKLLAIQRNANCTITINAPNLNQYTISLTNEVVDLANYHGQVVFTDAPDPSSALITFNPQGVCQVFGQFYLANQNRRYRVRATAAGGVSVHLSSGGQWV